MTKSPVEETKYEIPSWDHKSIHAIEKPDGVDDGSRPKHRIRRSMTACHTCRKLKTRCDLDPRGHACRRCLSLRIDCQLPETTERPQDGTPLWSDANTAIPSIEERLSSLEISMKEMTGMLQQLLEQSPRISNASTPRLARSISTDETASVEGNTSSFWTFRPKPAHIIHELQSELFREADCLAMDTTCMGSVMDPKLSVKLMQLFVDHFGPWVSLYVQSDVYNDTKQPESLLYNTACLLSSRYLPMAAMPMIYPMYLQARQEVTNLLWGRLPLKYETLQALSLLCLWPTASVQSGPSMDSWVLSGISIDHALMSFECLNHAPFEKMVDNDMVPRLRLWNALCLAQIQAAVASARPLHVPQRYLEHCPRLLEHPAATFDDGKVVAEIQLYMITLRLQNNYHRMKSAENGYEELERWKIDWAHLFNGENSSTIELNLWFCQILLHRTAMRYQSETERLALEVTQLSRLIVSRFLQVPLPTALGFIDHMYIILGYAALNLCDFNALDPLIENIQLYLLRLSPNENHITYRYSCMIADFKQRCTESQMSFGDTRKVPAEQMRPFAGAMGESYGSWDPLTSEVMSQPFPQGTLSTIAVPIESPAIFHPVSL